MPSGTENNSLVNQTNPRMLNRIKGIIRNRRYKLRYAMSKRGLTEIPASPLWSLPDGFTVRTLADTGVRLMDNFCTRAEAERMIDVCRDKVQRSTVINERKESVEHTYRTSSDMTLHVDGTDPVLKDLVFRASGLLGLPVQCVERTSITRYRSGEYYKSHFDHDGSIKADRLYTVLIYLNDLADEEGGGTMFPDLNVVARPVQGRAICWVNSDPDKSVRRESRHSALPVLKETAEKWVIQLWLRDYEGSQPVKPMLFQPLPAGAPLTGAEQLPNGITFVSDVDEESLFTDASSMAQQS